MFPFFKSEPKIPDGPLIARRLFESIPASAPFQNILRMVGEEQIDLGIRVHVATLLSAHLLFMRVLLGNHESYGLSPASLSVITNSMSDETKRLLRLMTKEFALIRVSALKAFPDAQVLASVRQFFLATSGVDIEKLNLDPADLFATMLVGHVQRYTKLFDDAGIREVKLSIFAAPKLSLVMKDFFIEIIFGRSADISPALDLELQGLCGRIIGDVAGLVKTQFG